MWLLQDGALLVNYVYAAGEPAAQTEAATSEPEQKAEEPAAPPAAAELAATKSESDTVE